jgi:cell division protein FtsB
MADRHSTTTIVRPRPASDSGAATRPMDAPDLPKAKRRRTVPEPAARPIPRSKQLARGRWKRLLVAAGATVIGAATIAALFVLPVKAWFTQGDESVAKRHELDVINAQNAQLEAEINRLNTDDGIGEAARREIGYTNRGEQRVTVIPAPAAPLTLPNGWPYDVISQIIAVRTNGAVIPNAAAATVAVAAATTPAASSTPPAAQRPAIPGGPALP